MTGTTYPLSFGQQGIWSIHEIRGAKSVYHDRAVFQLTGRLDMRAFRAAVELAVSRHEELRRRIVLIDGVPHQVSDDRWRSEVRVERAAPGVERAAALESFLRKETRRPFVLTEGPLFLVNVLGFDDESHVVAFTMHRIVADCWSLRVVLEEISRSYSDLLAGAEMRPCRPSTKYGDFALAQRSPRQAAEYEHLLAYWVDHVAGAPRVLDLRNGRAAAQSEQTAETLEFHIPAARVEQLRTFAKSCGATLYMGLLAAFEVAIAKAARVKDLLVGVPVAGRTTMDLEESIGYFVNVLALRGDLRDDPTSTQWMRRIRKAVLGGMAHQELPFEMLVAELGAPPSPKTHPLVQATIQLIDGAGGSDLQLEGIAAASIPAEEYQIAYALTLNLYTVPEGLRARLLFDPAEVDPELAAAIVEGIPRVIEWLPAHPDESVAELPPLKGPGRTSADGSWWEPVQVGDTSIDVRVSKKAPPGGRRLWPSVGEYPIYDDFFYYVMLQDQPRNEPFARAVADNASGRVVVELGAGPDLLWTSLAAERGARSVLAVEMLEDSARAAQKRAAALGPHVSVFHGDAMKVEPPAKADMCIAELVGAIGGSEGIGAILDDAWKRYLRPGAAVVPHRVRTPIAALAASELVGSEPALHPELAPYVGQVLRSVGSVFDLRMCLTGLTPEDLMTTTDLLEDLNLGANVQANAREVRLEITRTGAIDSCVLWLELQCAPEQPFLDSLRTVTNWMPVLVPFDLERPIPVRAGEVLELDIERRLYDDVHPEWSFTGSVRHLDGSSTPVRAECAYAGGPLRGSWLHRTLLRT